MKRLITFLLLSIPFLVSAQVQKDTVSVISKNQIPLGTADSTEFYFIENGAWRKVTTPMYISLLEGKKLRASSKVYIVNSVSDTSSISNPYEGDVAVNLTKDTLIIRDSLNWVLFFGGSGGGGNSNIDTIYNGYGIVTSPSPMVSSDTIRADTSVLATKSFVNNGLSSKLDSIAGEVTTFNIRDTAITTGKIATGAVTGAKLGSITSTEIRTALSDETGTGSAVFANNPVFTDINLNGTVGNATGNITLTNNSTPEWGIGAAGSGSTSDLIITNWLDANKRPLFIKQGNNYVGINTGVPLSQLHVVGKVRIDTLNSTPGALIGLGTDSTIVRLDPATYPTITELSYVKGVTSALQTQLSNKLDSLAGEVTTFVIRDTSVTWAKLAQAVKDSIAVTGGGGSGTVTSIIAGIGLTGGTITTSGTIAADTNFLVTVNDTAAMLTNYINVVDTATMLSTYINAADTASMLTNYINVSDTAAMLLTYINAADTAAMLSTYINTSDTAAMLLTYINAADTAAMLTNYINTVDTAAMLLPYLSKADTLSMLSTYVNFADTASMLLTYINAADTAAMLDSYINRADTAAMLSTYINVSDTSAMLNPYLKRTVDSIMFKTTYDGIATTGEMIWNDQSGTVHLGMTGNIEMPLGQAEAHMVRNTTGSQIAKGKVVYINGATGQRPTIALADADSEGASSGTFGVTAEAIDNNYTGFVFISGYIKGINTDTIAPGSALWLDTVPGNFTTTKRVAPVHTVLVGYSVTQANNGTIFVKVVNGQELGELHDVDVTSPVNGSLLRYNSTSAIWVDAQADSASIASNAIKNIHITNSAVNTSKLADSTVTALKIATATIANANIANATITAAKLVDSTITGVKLATGSVNLNSATTTGTLPVEKGGTGLTTFGAAGRVPYSTSASALTFDTIFRIDATNRNFQFGSGVMSGSRNIYIGDAETGVHRTSMGGAYNVGIGNNVGNNIGSTAFNNVLIGSAAGLNITSGDGNVLLNGGGGLTSGNNNIVIGVSAQAPTSTGSNNIVIGQQVSLANPNSNNQLALGNVIFATSMDSTGTAIPVNGKVGILNNAPGTALDVNGVITATAFQPLILRRDINSNGSQVQQIFQLKNSSGTYVNYGAIASEIISNTAGKQMGSMRFSVIDSTNNGTLNNRFILGGNGLSAIGTNLVFDPQKTLDVFGEVRIRDLDNGTATKLVGANNDGDLDSISIGSGLQLSAGVLSATGGGALTDGDKTDITVSNSGATWTIDSAAVTGEKTNFAGRDGDATRLLGAQTDGTTDTVQVGAGLTLSGGVLRSKSDTLAMIIAASDETTALTQGNAKVTFRAPFAMRIVGVRANVNTASTSGTPTIDINDTSVSILSTLLTIDVNQKTSVTASTAAVIDSSKRDIGNDDEMTIDIDTAGTGTKGLKITIYYTKN